MTLASAVTVVYAVRRAEYHPRGQSSGLMCLFSSLAAQGRAPELHLALLKHFYLFFCKAITAQPAHDSVYYSTVLEGELKGFAECL